MATREVANVKPPDLDTARYVKLKGVPIIDAYKKVRYKQDKEGNRVPYQDQITPKELDRICKNSVDRANKGELGILFVGHTDDHSPESKQPPIAGFMKDYRVGEYNNVPTILADVYVDTKNPVDPDVDSLLTQFPRRSVEIAGQNNPNGFIDSLALLKRLPARNLGLVTQRYKNKLEITRFSCPDCEDEMVAEQKTLESIVATAVEKTLGKLLSGGKLSRFAAMEKEEKEEKRKKKKAHKPEMSFDEEDEDESKEGDEDEDEEKEEDEEEDEKIEKAEGKEGKKKKHKKEHEKEKMGKKRYAAAEEPDEDDDEDEDEDVEDDDETESKPDPTILPPKDVKRMRQDSLQLKLSRFEAEQARDRKIIATLKSRLDGADKNTRIAKMEAIVTNLEALGYELDKPTEVKRFSALSDAEVDAEVSRIKRFHRRNPTGQPFIPGIADFGGNSIQEDEPESPPSLNESIVGMEVVRFSEQPEVAEKLRGIRDPIQKSAALNKLMKESRRKTS